MPKQGSKNPLIGNADQAGRVRTNSTDPEPELPRHGVGTQIYTNPNYEEPELPPSGHGPAGPERDLT
jgi:hypothetical protein